jgi:ABC-type Fe3+-hydroxamate transport system substrate-binding protein
MQKLKIFAIAFLITGSLTVCRAQDVVSAVKGTVKKVDTSTKTIVVESADGTDHTFHYVGRTVVHGANATDQATVHGVDKLGEGTKVVAHYTTAGGKDTVREIDRVGEDGLKTSDGTIDHIDRGTKTLTIKAADGTKTTFHLTDDAAADAGKGIAKGSEKSAHVTVYYTEDAGKKIAHFFEGS